MSLGEVALSQFVKTLSTTCTMRKRLTTLNVTLELQALDELGIRGGVIVQAHEGVEVSWSKDQGYLNVRKRRGRCKRAREQADCVARHRGGRTVDKGFSIAKRTIMARSPRWNMRGDVISIALPSNEVDTESLGYCCWWNVAASCWAIRW